MEVWRGPSSHGLVVGVVGGEREKGARAEMVEGFKETVFSQRRGQMHT